MNDTERAIKQFKEWEKDRWRLGKSPSIPTLILARQALEKQLIDENCNPFKWQKCKRKNGSEFLKLIYYSRTVDGYVEVGRFNMSKQELVQNEWSLDEIYEVLKNE